MGNAALTPRHPCSASQAGLAGDITMLKRIFTLTAVLAFIAALVGCNTVHGVGQDLEAAGEGIQEAAE